MLLGCFLLSNLAEAATWYVGPNGGTRYSTNTGASPGLTGVCDGTSPNAPVGTTPNQHCAFSDVRNLWTDGTFTNSPTAGFPAWGWIGTAGDTYVIAQNLSGGVDIGYRVGQNGPNSGDYYGLQGDPFEAGAPPPPTNATILGGNYANCGNFPNPGTSWTQAGVSAGKTQLYGGYAAGYVINLKGTSGVTIRCIDFTDHGTCVKAGTINKCATSYPLSDFAGEAMLFNNSMTNLTLTDVNAHGFTVSGWQGPVGTGLTATRVEIDGNAGAGWNADNGDGTTGTGNTVITNFIISHNGCSQEYPLVDTFPYNYCTDDATAGSAGYGDGFGTATVQSSPAWHVTFNIGEVGYNTQDGLDALHLTGGGSTMIAERVLSFSNMGNQLKEGAAGTILNSILINNCTALNTAAGTIGAPSGYNSQLSDFCRAGNEASLIAVNNGSLTTFAFNTVYGAGNGDLGGIVCQTTCTTTAALIYENNISLGFNTGSGNPARWIDGTGATGGVFAQTGSLLNHNLAFNTTTTCPFTGETSTLCVAPQLVSTSFPAFGYTNVAPSSGTANVVAAGIAISGITTDFAGTTRPNPPSIGAYDVTSTPPVNPPLNLNGVVIGGQLQLQ